MQAALGGLVTCWLPIARKRSWLHLGWEDTVQKWYDWLCEMKKKDEVEKMEEEHQKQVSQMIKSAGGSAGLLREITKPTAWRGGVQILMKEEENAQPMARCEEKSRVWAKQWHCDVDVQNQ